MNKTTNNALRLAVLAALAGSSVAAYAASTPRANELPNTVTLSAIPKTFSATTAFAPSSSQPLQITINLNNNTKFGSAPAVRCTVGATSASAFGFTTAAATTKQSIIPVLSLGGNGSTQAVFASTTAATAQIKSCVVSAAVLSVTGAHASVVESITFKYGNLASSNVSNTLVTWTSGVSAQAVTKRTVTAKVTAGFNKFSAGATLVSGGLSKAIPVSATQANTAAGGKGLLSAYLASGSITFAGTPLAAAKATAGVFVVATAATCSTANKLATAKGGAASVSFKLTPAQVSAGVRGCFVYSGTSAIPAGTITATLGSVAKTDYANPTFASADALEITRDGSSLSLLNMPRSTDTDAGFLRVYNTSTIAGAITATIYDQNGTALASNCSLSSSLAAGAALVMSAAQVETACGFTVPTTGRYRLEIAGAIPTMKGQMFARSSGVLTNVSADK